MTFQNKVSITEQFSIAGDSNQIKYFSNCLYLQLEIPIEEEWSRLCGIDAVANAANHYWRDGSAYAG
jgi:hypothetical protein